MDDKVKEFREYRVKMNEKILASNNKVIKRIYNIDTNTYMDGALSAKVKEMLGLATSMVLRCDDCIKYHLEKCHEQGVYCIGTQILCRMCNPLMFHRTRAAKLRTVQRFSLSNIDKKHSFRHSEL